MSHAVRVSEDLFLKAKTKAFSLHRSVAGQIEYWSKVGRIAEENPELPFSMIQDLLIGLEEIKIGHITLYQFG
ncbi:MAG: hypothetical protein NTV32_06795 [Gammaproteobacteria bacterium]|jgi:hypothetical protein|nr:hypothetical protein [Gammaproteobacteria bacterium]